MSDARLFVKQAHGDVDQMIRCANRPSPLPQSFKSAALASGGGGGSVAQRGTARPHPYIRVSKL